MSKFGKPKDITEKVLDRPVQPKLDMVGQLAIVLNRQGVYTTGIVIEPGCEIQNAFMLQKLKDGTIFKIIMNQLEHTQPNQYSIINQILEASNTEYEELPMISALQFGEGLLGSPDGLGE